MRKNKEYADTRFSAEVLRVAMQVARERAARSKVELGSISLSVDHEDSSWSYDTVDEFLADFRKYRGRAYFSAYGGDFDLTVSFTRRNATVSMKALTRVDIEAVFEVFEKHVAESKLPPPPQHLPPNPLSLSAMVVVKRGVI
jgi:hypothetical protein